MQEPSLLIRQKHSIRNLGGMRKVDNLIICYRSFFKNKKEKNSLFFKEINNQFYTFQSTQLLMSLMFTDKAKKSRQNMLYSMLRRTLE